ncbi:MAG: class I SAM-dependent rRNA methyltransferase [Acidobacteriota bacterium]
MIDTVRISAKGVDRVRAGHLWIYRSDLLPWDRDGAPEPGSIVSVEDKKGRPWARAFFSSESLISLRILTTEEVEVGWDFFRQRVESAWSLRKRVVSGTEVYRVVHGEGDGLPSIVVDKYGDILCLQTLSQGADRLKPMIVQILRDLLQPRSIIERNDTRIRSLEGLESRTAVLYGEDPGEVVCSENGLRFHFQPSSGQKTGAFLDQRENRRLLQDLAFGEGLDCFCYSGAFAIHMAKSCQSVEGVDISESAIEQASRNAGLNDARNVKFEVDNAFDRLRLYDHLKRKFDTINLDPPAFAKSRAQVDSALRGYKEINLRALKLLKPGGILVTSSCSQLIDENLFLNLLVEAAADAGRQIQVVCKRSQSRDHPFLISMPETHYLKCLFLRALN